MADLPRSQLASIRHGVSDMIRCSVCHGDSEDPRYLPCLHSFCLVCISDSLCPMHQIKCPECLQITDVPSGGLEKLPVEFRIKKLQDIMERHQTLQVHV